MSEGAELLSGAKEQEQESRSPERSEETGAGEHGSRGTPAPPHLRTSAPPLHIPIGGWVLSLGIGLVVLVGLLVGQERWAVRPVLSTPAVTTPALQPTPVDSFLRDYADLAPAPVSGEPGMPSFGDAAGFLLKFGIVLLVLYGSLRGLRTFMARQHWLPASNTRVTVVETTHLSPKRALYVVRAGSQMLLLGGTDHEITVLAELVEDTRPAGQVRPEEFATQLAVAGRVSTDKRMEKG